MSILFSFGRQPFLPSDNQPTARKHNNHEYGEAFLALDLRRSWQCVGGFRACIFPFSVDVLANLNRTTFLTGSRSLGHCHFHSFSHLMLFLSMFSFGKSTLDSSTCQLRFLSDTAIGHRPNGFFPSNNQPTAGTKPTTSRIKRHDIAFYWS